MNGLTLSSLSSFSFSSPPSSAGSSGQWSFVREMEQKGKQFGAEQYWAPTCLVYEHIYLLIFNGIFSHEVGL